MDQTLLFCDVIDVVALVRLGARLPYRKSL